jgi:protein involved in polysaccharide export with SLBB domain
MKNTSLLFAAGMALAVLAGCATKGPEFDPRHGQVSSPFTEPVSLQTTSVVNTLDPVLLKPSADFFTLGPGDQIEVEILGTPASRTMLNVGPDGKIYFSLLPGLDVWGLNMSETKALLDKELGKFISNAQVTVSLRAVGSKYVWLLGRLNKPGIYPTTAPMTLLEAIAQAGGTANAASAVTTEDLSDLRHSFVVRQGQILPVDFHKLLRQGDMSQNVYLKADDFVYVPSSLDREIYVMGALRVPHAVPFRENTTLISVIAACGGTVKDAYKSHVAIVRGSLSSPQIAIVDYNDIVSGKTSDILLEPHDIVYVPLSPYRVLTRYLELIVNTFANSIAANEGIAASGGVRVGVAVPVGGP